MNAAIQSQREGVVLTAQNLLLQFGGVVALNDVSIDVRKDELLAIIGPNGAGKSSLMNCLSGFYRPKKGEISLAITFAAQRSGRNRMPRMVSISPCAVTPYRPRATLWG